MISYEFFDLILYENFLKPLRIQPICYSPAYSTRAEDIETDKFNTQHDFMWGICYYLFEEPFNELDFSESEDIMSLGQFDWSHSPRGACWNIYARFLANSEISPAIKYWCRKNNLLNWYFFYHGFAARSWFNGYKHLPVPDKKPTHVFISYNHLITHNRSYRLTLLANIINNNLDQYGLISAPLLGHDIIHNELINSNSRLSVESKKLIHSTLLSKSPYVLDVENPQGTLSANINLELNHNAFWHVVTETVFYDDKLHLTEKIFKPIVSKQPFILVGAANNLKYLRSYGFKTFDRWIDESYDEEIDPDARIQKIVAELKKLCDMSFDELQAMQADMKDVLEFNRNHFYGEFGNIIATEMIDNFEKCVDIYNQDLSERFRLNKPNLNINDIKQRFIN